MRAGVAIFVGLLLSLFAAAAKAEESPPAHAGEASHADFERMRLVLRQVSSSQRTHRHATAVGQAAGGALHLGVGLTVMARVGVGRLAEQEQVFGLAQTIVGGVLLVTSPLPLLFSDRGEQLHAEFERDASEHPNDRAGVVLRSEKRLFEAAASARSERHFTLVALGALTLAEGTLFVLNEVRDDPNSGIRFGLGSGLLAAGAGTFAQLFPTELERLAEVWKSDPAAPDAAIRRLPRVGFAPLSGGGMASVGGVF